MENMDNKDKLNQKPDSDALLNRATSDEYKYGFTSDRDHTRGSQRRCGAPHLSKKGRA